MNFYDMANLKETIVTKDLIAFINSFSQ